jgi:hypothetical protein
MVGIRVIQLQEVKPASPLHRQWIKNRRGGDIVALIDATQAQTQRVSSNPAIPPAPVTAAAAPSRSAAFFFNRRCRGSSTDGAEADQFAPLRSRTRTSRALLPPASAAGAPEMPLADRHRLDRRRRDGPPGGQQPGHPERRSGHSRHGFERCLRPLTHKNRKFRPVRTFWPWSGRLPNCEPG